MTTQTDQPTVTVQLPPHSIESGSQRHWRKYHERCGDDMESAVWASGDLAGTISFALHSRFSVDWRMPRDEARAYAASILAACEYDEDLETAEATPA